MASARPPGSERSFPSFPYGDPYARWQLRDLHRKAGAPEPIKVIDVTPKEQADDEAGPAIVEIDGNETFKPE
jgi:hypothetical protein